MNDTKKKKVDVLDLVTKILIDQLGASEKEVTLEAKLRDDLGADSLDGLELIMEAESVFGIEIPDEDDLENKIVTVKDAVDYIEKRLQPNV